MSRSSKILLWSLLGVVVILVLSIVLFNSLTGPTELSLTQFVNKIESGEIDRITFDNYVYTGVDEDTGARYRAVGDRTGNHGQDNGTSDTVTEEGRLWEAVNAQREAGMK